MLIKLAWMNVWRNRKRSLIVVAAITFGLWGGLFSGGVMMGMGESMVNTAVDRDLAHIQIHKQGYARGKDVRDFIPGGTDLIRQTAGMTGVQAVSGRTLVYGMAASPTSTFGVRIVGIDPSAARTVSTLYRYVAEGTFFSSETRNPVLIGSKLADRLKLRLRSKIILNFEGLDGEIVYIACRVTGIFKTESARFDEMNVFLDRTDLFRVLGTDPIVHEAAFRLATASDVPAVTAALRERYPDLQVETWKEISPDLAFLAETMKSFTYLFVTIILFALLFGITNTMLMSVMDRVRELGMLIAVGMKKRQIFFMIIWETVFLSLTGGLLGILIGGVSIAAGGRYGIDLSSFSTSLASFGVGTELYPFLPGAMYAVLTVMIVVAANVAAMLPAWKAIHLEPAEAIRTY